MSLISCIIVDDEKSARNVLTSLIDSYFNQIEVLASCQDVPEAVEKIKELKPDLVFLDVQMPNYAGYEIIQFFTEIDFEIIFVTAYDKYAIKAFELSAIDYLVKPVSRIRMKEAVEKLETKLDRSNKILDYQNLLNSIRKDDFDTLIIPELGNKRLIKLSDIIAVEANGAYSIIHLLEDKKITISKNLKYFENLLPENNQFFRSHRTWLINLKLIVSFNKTELEISHVSGFTSKLSRRKLPGFEQIFIS